VLPVALASVLAALGITGSAHAAAPVPFTLTDTIDFETGVGHFTTTGALCESGTFSDDVRVQAFARSELARSGGGIVMIRTVFTCDDGSGTFDALKHLTLRFTPTGFTTIGPFEILGGTGAYAGLTGYGVSDGATDFSTNRRRRHDRRRPTPLRAEPGAAARTSGAHSRSRVPVCGWSA
jgi:hypothetical protein